MKISRRRHTGVPWRFVGIIAIVVMIGVSQLRDLSYLPIPKDKALTGKSRQVGLHSAAPYEGYKPSAAEAYMLQHADQYDWNVTVGDIDLATVETKIGGHLRGKAVYFDCYDNELMEKHIKGSDIVISLLPPGMHSKAAKIALRHNAHVVTASYASQEMIEMHVEAEAKDTTETEEESYKDKYFYLAAEMQNMQKRFEKEKENLLKYGHERVLTDILDVVDNLERTLGFIRGDEDPKVKNLVIGLDMIEKMFLESLGKHGLKPIDALGKEFDPNFHEALSQVPVEGKKNMEVHEVQQRGYTLNDRVLRASKVIVVKNEE